jgi:peptidoglycan/xylan/chitin deacetylase (PgdA/CDA1 family)
MKNSIKKALLRTGWLQLAARFRGPSTAILMYHSVMENPSWQQNLLGGIVHGRDVFRKQMEILARDFRPVSLDQVKSFARSGKELPDRTVVVTFDDGYADNYEIAAPILNEVGVPAVFYITVDCVAHHKVPWPARLRFSFQATKKENWNDSSGKAWPLRDQSQREEAFGNSCDECCSLSGKAQEEYIARLELELDAQVPAESGALMMNYEQVRGLARQGHIVGSHTMTHPNLAKVSAADAQVEMVESKQRLEQQLKSTVQHFSYPCPTRPPNWTKATQEESRKAGYETAVTTENGVVRETDNPLRWKRVLPTKTVEGLKWSLACAFAGRATGIPHS